MNQTVNVVVEKLVAFFNDQLARYAEHHYITRRSFLDLHPSFSSGPRTGQGLSPLAPKQRTRSRHDNGTLWQQLMVRRKPYTVPDDFNPIKKTNGF